MGVMRTGFVTMVIISHTLVILVSVLIASWIRFGNQSGRHWQEILAQPLLGLLGYIALALTVFYLVGLYRFDTRWTIRAQLFDSAKAVAILGIVTLAMLFVLQVPPMSRIFLTTFFILLWVGITMTTVAVRSFYAHRRATGKGTRHVVVVGTNPSVIPFIKRLTSNHPELGVRIVGYVGDGPSHLGDILHLGAADRLSEVLASIVVDEVIVAPERDEVEHLDEIVLAAREQGKTIRILLPSMGYSISRGDIEMFDGVPLLTVSSTSNRQLSLAAKRLVDLAGSTLGFALLSPLFALTALVIWFKEGRPILFRQTRVGIHGRHFKLVKFRTMLPNAAAMKPSLMILNERNGPAFKLRNDPRVTPTGKILRKSSIDELPQLWNVLIGQMSLVGPRPPLPDEVSEYDPWHRRRLSMKPGITGLWQVSARNDPDFDSWVETDLKYIDNWSPLLDATILVRTLPAVLKSPGA